jgi:hypothetical protein
VRTSKGKAEGWREQHHAVMALSCQALFLILKQTVHADFSLWLAAGLDFPLFRCGTALPSSSNLRSPVPIAFFDKLREKD